MPERTILALFFVQLVALIPPVATAPALILAGFVDDGAGPPDRLARRHRRCAGVPDDPADAADLRRRDLTPGRPRIDRAVAGEAFPRHRLESQDAVTCYGKHNRGEMVEKQTFGLAMLLFTLFGESAAHAAPPGTFQPVGDTTTPRLFATATLLNDGT